MSPSDLIAIVAAGVAALSFVVSLWAAYKASKIGDYQIRLSNKSELHSMLLEIDRELLHDPTLYAMFRSSPTGMPVSASAMDIAKQDTYVAMYLNLFELSFAQFKEISRLNAAEREASEAWDRFAASFLEDCIPAKATWAKLRTTYYVSFQDYIDGLIAKIDSEGGAGSANRKPPNRSFQPKSDGVPLER